MRISLACSIWAAASLAACTLDDERVVPDEFPDIITDTTGAEFSWTCDTRGCRVGMLEQTPLPPPCWLNEWPSYGSLMGRYFVVTGACVSRGAWVWQRSWERALTCSDDSDCPRVYQPSRTYEYECRDGLCQNVDTEAFPTKELSYDEAFPLCLASIDREDSLDPFSEASLEVAELIDEVCSDTGSRDCELPLPAGCLQP